MSTTTSFSDTFFSDSELINSFRQFMVQATSGAIVASIRSHKQSITKNQLKSYSKKYFDPFCRRDRIMFECIGHKLETTLGQLNFFKWGIETMLLEYILENYDDIETDMNTCYNASKKNKKDNTRKKRQELSKNHSRGLNLSNHRIRLDFT